MSIYIIFTATDTFIEGTKANAEYRYKTEKTEQMKPRVYCIPNALDVSGDFE